MNLKAIVSVSGKPGLYKLVGQNKSGFIIETLDDKKIKSVVNMNKNKLATLEDITVYGIEDEIKLEDIFTKMKESDNIPDVKAKGDDLREFFTEVAPNHDDIRVYTSDIKKIISWFNILKELPLFEEEKEEKEENTEKA